MDRDYYNHNCNNLSSIFYLSISAKKHMWSPVIFSFLPVTPFSHTCRTWGSCALIMRTWGTFYYQIHIMQNLTAKTCSLPRSIISKTHPSILVFFEQEHSHLLHNDLRYKSRHTILCKSVTDEVQISVWLHEECKMSWLPARTHLHVCLVSLCHAHDEP